MKIIGDRDKLIEIFTNLIDNSIKYSDKNKEITITAKKDGEFNTVSVSDQGIGIPKESIHRITERFFTVCLLYTSPSPRDAHESRMPSSA